MKMIGLLIVVPMLSAVVLLQCTASPTGDLAAATGQQAEPAEKRSRRYADDASAGCLAKLELEEALEQIQNPEEPREDEGEGNRERKRTGNYIPSGYIPIRGRRTFRGRSLDSMTFDAWGRQEGRPSLESTANFKKSPLPPPRPMAGFFGGRGRK